MAGLCPLPLQEQADQGTLKESNRRTFRLTPTPYSAAARLKPMTLHYTPDVSAQTL